jgi:hypothetical protein
MEMGTVALVDMYVLHGVVPCVAVIEPVIGTVVLVDTYTFHGVVYCETLIGVLTTETGSVTLVTTYD